MIILDDAGFELEEEDTSIAGQNFYLIDTPGAVGTGGSGTATIGGLNVGDVYSFRIRADHANGTVSGYASTTYAPTGPTASISAVAESGGAIAINFSAALPSDNAPITGYIIDEQGSYAVGDQWAELEGVSSSQTNAEVAANKGETKIFRVQAHYTDGSSSAWSSSASATAVGGNTYTPSVTATVVSDTEVDLSFTSDPADIAANSLVNYAIYYAPVNAINGGGQSPINGDQNLAAGANGTVAVTGLTPGVNYDFAVQNQWSLASENSAAYNVAHATAMTSGSVAPPTPTGLVAVHDPSNSDNIDVHWHNDSPAETGYVLQRSADDGGSWTSVATVGADVTSYQDTEPTPQAHLIYRVAVETAAAQSPWSLVTSPLGITLKLKAEATTGGGTVSLEKGKGNVVVTADGESLADRQVVITSVKPALPAGASIELPPDKQTPALRLNGLDCLIIATGLPPGKYTLKLDLRDKQGDTVIPATIIIEN